MNDEVGEPRQRTAALHRPWRVVIAGCELLVAVAAVWCAMRIWGLGVRTLTVTLSDGTRLTSLRFFGSWMTGAIGLGTVAGILLVDAVREMLLGIGVKYRRHRRRAGSTGSIEGQLTHLNGS